MRRILLTVLVHRSSPSRTARYGDHRPSPSPGNTRPASAGQPTCDLLADRRHGAVGAVRRSAPSRARSATAARACRASRRDRTRTRPRPGSGCRAPAAAPRASDTRSGRSASVAGPAAASPGSAARARRRCGTRPAPPSSPEESRAADEAGDEAVGRPLVEIALRADLPHRAFAHDDEAVGHGQRLLLVVRDHHGGEAELALQLADLDPHLLPQLGVEVRQRLVEQQHVGPEHQRAGQRHALLLAARELARQALAEMRRGAPAAAPRRRAPAISAGATLRISSPKATFCATVRCGKSA